MSVFLSFLYVFPEFPPDWDFSDFKSFLKDLVHGFDGPVVEYWAPKLRAARIRILDI